MKLVLWNNINIWPSCGPQMVHMPIFGQPFKFLVISRQIGLKIFIGAQETFIQRLVIRVQLQDIMLIF